MVGVYDYKQRIGNFRVDRIAKCPVILNEEGTPAPEDFNIDEYINTTFRMFNSEHAEVELICDNEVMPLTTAFLHLTLYCFVASRRFRPVVFSTKFGGCNALQGVYFKGDAPDLRGYDFGTVRSKEFVVYYDGNTSGGDDTPLREWYTLVEK